MTPLPKIDMQEATRLTREGRLADAMVVLRGALAATPSGIEQHATMQSLGARRAFLTWCRHQWGPQAPGRCPKRVRTRLTV